MALLRGSLSRRGFLAALMSTIAAAADPVGLSWPRAPRAAAAPATASPASLSQLRHVAWVWNFSADGTPEAMRSVLAAHNLGVAVKTHDGVEWMAKYDKSPHAIGGPPQVEGLVRYFEDAGVPFHTWSLVKGRDPVQEARMAAAVLDAGARTMMLDLEPHAGFWEGTPEAALAFGAEFRRLQPHAWLAVSYDPRPWVVTRVPLKEFASFSNELAPQLYWESFGTQPNLVRFAAEGSSPGDGGVTPQFLLDLTLASVRSFNLPVQPIGQGAAATVAQWQAFLDHSFSKGIEAVSVWRYGVTDRQILQLLKEHAPRPRVYIIQPGDTLSKLAESWNTSVQAISELNGISNPNLISVGQQIVVPGRAVPGGPTARRAAAAVPSQASTYTVQSGDTLSGLAQRWRTTVRAIAEANNIGNTDYIYQGQQLRIP